jgi:hypothetical protein
LSQYTDNLKKLKCFFQYPLITAQANKEKRMPQYNYTRNKKNNQQTPFYRTEMNGANDLREYIREITESAHQIHLEFFRDIKSPDAVAEHTTRLCRGNHDFRSEMASVAHHSFVYERAELPQSSRFLQAEAQVDECLRLLENIRKMLVDNKQTKRTNIRTIKQIMATFTETETLPLPNYDFVMTGDARDAAEANALGAELHCELESNHPTITHLKKLIETTKQHHRTVSSRLLCQVREIMVALRTRHMLALRHASETTISEIIIHAQKVRAFMAKSFHLAVIEYCASSWWFTTQKDAMDDKYYYVSVVAIGEPKEFDANAPHQPCNATSMPLLKIQVHGVAEAMGQENPLYGEYMLDQELADTILTEEAIQAFECEQQMKGQKPQVAEVEVAPLSWYQ